MNNRKYLFHEGDLSRTLEVHGQTLAQKVDSIPQEQFLSTPVDDLVEHISAQMLVDPLVIHEDAMTREQQETKIDVAGWPGRFTRGNGPCLVPAIEVMVSLPFTGDASLWKLRPNTLGPLLPHGVVKGSCLHMTFAQPLDQPLEQIRKSLEENLNSIRTQIALQADAVSQFNVSLPGKARTCIQVRRKQLEKHDALGAILDIPLHRDPHAPEMKAIPVQKRIIKPLPPAPTGGHKQEWEISNQEYENILTIIRHEGRTFEATPRTYAVHGEEELRDIILAHLNGHYKGNASGETFRRTGKTDIHIKTESRSAFVAECKLWKGQKTVAASVNQLLSYLTWRDCKTAVVIFNKDVAGFTSLLGKIGSALEAHPHFKKVIPNTTQAEWRCVFQSAEDDSRLVHVHVFLFNIYISRKEKNPTTPSIETPSE